jgi:hypothetical protein
MRIFSIRTKFLELSLLIQVCKAFKTGILVHGCHLQVCWRLNDSAIVQHFELILKF